MKAVQDLIKICKTFEGYDDYSRSVPDGFTDVFNKAREYLMTLETDLSEIQRLSSHGHEDLVTAEHALRTITLLAHSLIEDGKGNERTN